MTDPNHHPDCPRCKGQGFYLRREGHGFYRDGSFGHNDWQDCDCYPEMKLERLPKAVDPTPRADRVAMARATPKAQEPSDADR